MSCGPGMSQSSTVECKTLNPVGMVWISLWLLSLLAWHAPLYCARQTGESETIVRVFLYLTFWQPLINITTFLFACWEKELFSSTLLKCSPFRLTEVQLFAVASCCWYFLERSFNPLSAVSVFVTIHLKNGSCFSISDHQTKLKGRQGLSAYQILQLRRPCSKFHCIELHLKCNLEQHYV